MGTCILGYTDATDNKDVIIRFLFSMYKWEIHALQVFIVILELSLVCGDAMGQRDY
jgi:hypothetical protein